MFCSTKGSMPSLSSAWWPAPPRYFWSTGAGEPDRAASERQRPPGFRRRAFARDAAGDQRFDFLAFFFFLAAFFAVFVTAFLADFLTADFLPAFLAFLAFFFGAFLVTAFLAA